MYYKLYEVNPPKKKITTSNLEDILGKCNKDKVVNTVPDDDVKSELNSFITKYHSKKNNNKNVHEWANTLKHRRMIEYEELDRKHPACIITLSRLPEIVVKGQIPLKEAPQEEIKILYNSNNTLKRIKMTDVINVLFEYHKDICQLSRLVFDKIEF